MRDFTLRPGLSYYESSLLGLRSTILLSCFPLALNWYGISTADFKECQFLTT
jgi:hypothetical protein